MDFKIAFDRNSKEPFRAAMRKKTISANIVRAMKPSHDKATSAFRKNGCTGNGSEEQLGIRQVFSKNYI